MFSDCLFAVWCSLKYKTQPVKRNGYHLSLQNGWNSIDMVWSGKYVGHIDEIFQHFGFEIVMNHLLSALMIRVIK